MNSKSLERWQVQQLLNRVQQELVFLSRLEGRMLQMHFPRNDRLYDSVRKSLTAINDLSIELYRLLDSSALKLGKRD
jgi:hypothetical protein